MGSNCLCFAEDYYEYLGQAFDNLENEKKKLKKARAMASVEPDFTPKLITGLLDEVQNFQLNLNFDQITKLI